METEHTQNAAVLKELSDIKASLAVNTEATKNIKESMVEMKTDIREIKTDGVTQSQLKVLSDIVSSQGNNLQTAQINIARIFTWGSAAILALGVLEFIINKYF